MRTSLTLDDGLLATAAALTGVRQKSALVSEALKALIERESARQLARFGGSEPELEFCRRQRSPLHRLRRSPSPKGGGS